MDGTVRQAVTVAAELLWDDLLDAVEADTVTDALLLGLLPSPVPRPAPSATGDAGWPTFTTVVWKLGQPARAPPATMAEQMCVGAGVGYTQRTWSTWHATG